MNLRPGQPIIDNLERARAIVLEYGWNATCYQVLNPGIDLWFASDADAVVGYVTAGKTRVVAGAPICAESELSAVVESFESDASRHRERVCYFGAEARLETVLRSTPFHSSILLGAQPVWDPAHWQSIVASHPSLRQQLNRARNKNVTVEEWSLERASHSRELVECLHYWLSNRPLPPLHFLVEPDTLGRLFDRRVFVAQRSGEVISFLVASPVPRRDGWLIEQIVRGKGAINGVSELLVDFAIRSFASEKSAYVTLGLSPLSRRAPLIESPSESKLIRLMLALVRAHGTRFYNFEGLDAFKSKFIPDRWEPVYAFANEPRFTIRTLHAIARAFSGRSLTSVALSAIGRVARTSRGDKRR